MRTCADLKGIHAHWYHFMLQPGAILWFKAQILRKMLSEGRHLNSINVSL
jgi:hypothetical protein